MKNYVILRTPGHNQVYFQNSATLSQEELALTGLPLTHIQEKSLGGLSYISFSAEEELSPTHLEALSRLSFLYGLFQESQGQLTPVLLPDPQVLHRSLSTILKYSGKTNEIFTRFLVNLAFSTANIHPKEGKLLDPVAGRGTTLFDGLSLGASCSGVELQEKSVTDGYNHLKKFLEVEKIKHKTGSIRVSGAGKSFTAKRHTVDFNSQHFELICGDSKYTNQLFSKETFHVVVGDLPYGVQHGNHAGKLQRNPAQLVGVCAPGWREVMKPQGVLVLAWNTLVLPRDKMEETLQRAGFQVLKNDHLTNLAHQVDASIQRDIVVAKKAKG